LFSTAASYNKAMDEIFRLMNKTERNRARPKKNGAPFLLMPMLTKKKTPCHPGAIHYRRND